MTDEHQQQEHDPDLRALLRAVDPAGSLPQADPTRVARLLEDTMADQHTDESRSDGTRHRSPLTWLVAAAAVLAIGGGVAFAVTQGGDDDVVPTAGPGDSASVDAGTATPGGTPDPAGNETVTELTLGPAVGAKCIAATPGNEQAVRIVADQDVALDGTVESISGSAVTLVPTKFYAGEPTDKVVVQAPDEDMQALLSAVSFEEGGRYLVSATDGRVTVCSFSGAYSEPLAELYAEAFPG